MLYEIATYAQTLLDEFRPRKRIPPPPPPPPIEPPIELNPENEVC